MTTILIVDDNNINRKLLRVILESEGYKVIPVSDGLEALDQLQDRSIDLIVTDILMPNLDGYNLCKKIRSKPVYDTIPIIVYSSTYTDAPDKTLAFDLGADEFITKPTSNQTILDAIEYHINQGRDVSKPIQSTFEETQILRKYNKVLINKLENKNKQLENKISRLRESESKFRMVVENINDVFFLIDIDNNKIEYVSPTYENIWGRSISELYNDPDSLIKSMISEIDFQISDLDNIEYGTSTEFQIENPDKGICWVRLQFYPIVDNNSKNRNRLVCVAKDITELRIMRAQFMQSQKMDSLGRLVGGIAHDFNNVLMVIQASTDILTMICEDEPVIKEIKNIQEAADSGSQLTKQLLTFGRTNTFDMELVNLNDIISNMQGMINRIIGGHIQLSYHLRNNLTPIRIDPSQLQHAILNLIINARDAVIDGGKIDIHTDLIPRSSTDETIQEEFDNENIVVLRIKDNGKGMDNETQNKVFQPFFSTKKMNEGTGLGLSIVQGIVKRSKGYIEVKSEPEKGTEFNLYFPSMNFEDQTVSKGQRPIKSNLDGNETILYVEDDVKIREQITKILEFNGYNVIVGESGLSGLNVYYQYQQSIDLIIIDLIMPQTDGIEMYEKIYHEDQDIKFLFTSGYANKLTDLLGIPNINYDLIDKPFTSTVLLEKIRNIFDNSD